MAILSDIRFALRALSRRPGVPLVIAGLFALSVGLASGMWAVIDAVLLRPLPYRDGHQLVVILETHKERGAMAVTRANFFDWASRTTTLQDATGLGALEASVSGRGAPVQVIGTKVTERFTELMGVRPILGRGLHAEDFRGDGRVAVIGYGLWTRQFDRDPNAIGARLTIDGQPYTVAGIMPADFKMIGHPELWVPWIMSAEERSNRRFHELGAMARVRPGRTVADAQQEMSALYAQLRAEHPGTTAGWSATVQTLRDLMLGDTRQALLILGIAISVLLIVASINVAGLLRAWLPTRRQEFVIRMAIGASPQRVVRQLLLETLTWAIAGMAGGLALAVWFVRLFGAVGVSRDMPYAFEPRLDARVILTMTLLLVVNVAVTALIPSIVSVRRSTDLVPRRARRTGVAGHHAAIAVQVALSVVLLCAAAELLIGFDKLTAFASRGRASALAVEITLPDARYKDDASQARFFERLLTALGSRPELTAAATASYVPPQRIYGNIRFEIEGRSTSADAQTTLASAVSPGAFPLLDIPLVRGRLIEDRDAAGAPHAGVISEALARRYWPREDPIGHRIRLGFDAKTWITIVGVVRDVAQPLSADTRVESVLYLSYRQVPFYYTRILVVPSGGAAPALAAVREEVARIDPAQAVGAPRGIDEIRTEWLELPRLRTAIVTLFGVSTLLLTLVGLYARVAYAAASRTRELAIRQALGARPADLVRTLASEALVVVMLGVIAGIALLPAVSASLQSVVRGLPRSGVGLAAIVAAAFGVAAVASTYWPARRAGRVNPAELLRSE